MQTLPLPPLAAKPRHALLFFPSSTHRGDFFALACIACIGSLFSLAALIAAISARHRVSTYPVPGSSQGCTRRLRGAQGWWEQHRHNSRCTGPPTPLWGIIIHRFWKDNFGGGETAGATADTRSGPRGRACPASRAGELLHPLGCTLGPRCSPTHRPAMERGISFVVG